MNKLTLLGLLIALTINCQEASASTLVSLEHSYLAEDPYQIESKAGVVETVYAKTFKYVYKCSDGSTIELYDDLSKQVQDNRPIIEKHPKLSKFRAFCSFVNPMLVFIGLVF